MLKKYKPNGEIEFIPVYFNSTTKTAINNKLISKMQLIDNYHEVLMHS